LYWAWFLLLLLLYRLNESVSKISRCKKFIYKYSFFPSSIKCVSSVSNFFAHVVGVNKYPREYIYSYKYIHMLPLQMWCNYVNVEFAVYKLLVLLFCCCCCCGGFEICVGMRKQDQTDQFKIPISRYIMC